MLTPAAARKVFAIPPPTTSESTFSTSALSTSSLDDTLLPPTIAVMGLAGSASALPSADNSADSSGPAHATGAKRATPSVLAWALCAVPKASITKMSASDASFLERLSSLLFSPTLTRIFSNRRMSSSPKETPSR